MAARIPAIPAPMTATRRSVGIPIRRTADGWRIATRDVHVLWTSTEALTS